MAIYKKQFTETGLIGPVITPLSNPNGQYGQNFNTALRSFYHPRPAGLVNGESRFTVAMDFQMLVNGPFHTDHLGIAVRHNHLSTTGPGHASTAVIAGNTASWWNPAGYPGYVGIEQIYAVPSRRPDPNNHWPLGHPLANLQVNDVATLVIDSVIYPVHGYNPGAAVRVLVNGRPVLSSPLIPGVPGGAYLNSEWFSLFTIAGTSDLAYKNIRSYWSHATEWVANP